MIDIHSHLLYGIDDGAPSFESSVEMLKAAEKEGVEAIVLTPHFSLDIAVKMQEKIEKLRPEAAKFNIELFAGCEYNFSHLREHEKLITLGGKGGFILVDFCLSFITPISRNILFEQQSKGYQIIIAHPERLFCKDDLPMLKALAEYDMYFQLNAGSFRGDYGRSARRFAKLMVKNGLCHFIASDAHSARNYNGQIPYCRKYISRYLGTELEKVIFEENPERMLAGNPLISI